MNKKHEVDLYKDEVTSQGKRRLRCEWTHVLDNPEILELDGEWENEITEAMAKAMAEELMRNYTKDEIENLRKDWDMSEKKHYLIYSEFGKTELHFNLTPKQVFSEIMNYRDKYDIDKLRDVKHKIIEEKDRLKPLKELV